MSVLEPAVLSVIAILVMAAVTFLMRAGGYWMMGHVPLTPRVRGMLEALPGSIVVAIVLPVVAKSGIAAVAAIGLAASMMVLRGNAFLAVVAGLAAAMLARHVGM